jgi:Holliday junction resolvase RusA-like endonuclease
MPRPKATPRPATTYIVEIPDFLPVSLNQLLRAHWRERHARMRREAALIVACCMLARVPPADGKRRVTQRLTLAGNDRERDDDNAWKALLDALVKGRLLVDDGPAWVERMPLRQERGPRRMTTIYLEDLPCE